MPEATVHEYRDFLRAEDEIRFPTQRCSASPPDNVAFTHQRDEPEFRGIISLPAHARHTF
jgi:hypothetical protein